MTLSEIQIETDRLRLLPISMDFAGDLFREFTPEITRFMFPKPPDEIEDTYQFIQQSKFCMEKELDLVMIITDRSGSGFIGCCGLHKIHTPHPELGIWIRTGAHGNGYGYESVAAMVRWAEQELDYEYLIYPVDERNTASRRIPKRLGGQAFRAYEKKNESGNLLRIVVYRIFKS